MKKTIFIGQAMPRHKGNLHDWPSLNKWLYSINLTDDLIKEHFYYSALVDYFPGASNGSHIVPSKEDIENEKSRLSKIIKNFDPELVVPIGALSISYCIGEKVQPLANNIGKSYILDPYALVGRKLKVIPLPHPSGASTWRYKKGNKKLLEDALALLRQELFA